MNHDFVWVFNKPGEQDVVQIPEAPTRAEPPADIWWGLMVLLVQIITGSIR